MTDFSSLIVADRGQNAAPIHLVDKAGFDGWVKKRPAEDRARPHAASVTTHVAPAPPDSVRVDNSHLHG